MDQIKIGKFIQEKRKEHKLTQSDLAILTPILDAPRQTTQYFDDNKQRMVTMTTYSGDWKETSKNIGKVEGVECSFISVAKRS